MTTVLDFPVASGGAAVPAPLWCGLDYGPAVVVLSPSARRPTELPIAWQPLEQRFQIAWCAVPRDARSLHRVEDVLETLADRNVRTHFVAHSALAEVACRMVAEFPGIARGLVLVGSGELPEPTGIPSRVLTIADSAGDETDLVHPYVVAEVSAALERVTTAPAARVRLRLPDHDPVALGGVRRESSLIRRNAG
ncbi:hypothetical protein [Actinokineospora enzanensis]|uniref:hypothetical protein n=1 Tax=Actinokineospora enzanensis TaxID=155975 RepID=UPI00035CB249|nr:hypothetical protein [Actinokineospora enzanensis]